MNEFDSAFQQNSHQLIQTTDKSSAFKDDYVVSAYQQVKTNNARMNVDMVHATSSAPYHQRRKIK